ncbi:MAG: lipopolysaccharide kinase InaA family protein [Caldimicrobium sp.]|jgi:tRNA A-37 threonylcarbamoyl transferase component Bud32
MIQKNLTIIEKENFQINIEYLLYFEKLLNPYPEILKELPEPFFKHQKRYRQIFGFDLKGIRFYLKIYSDRLFEAKSEWKNLCFLYEKGFNPPKPLFFFHNSSYALIATEEVPGKPLSELLKEKPSLLKVLAQFLASFHKEKLFHQDCYLNHFYWDGEKIYILDVSRVKVGPLFTLKYHIKDLAQLGYSFENYLHEKSSEFLETFLNFYENYFHSLSPIFKFLLSLKIKRIRQRTERVRKKGKPL